MQAHIICWGSHLVSPRSIYLKMPQGGCQFSLRLSPRNRCVGIKTLSCLDLMKMWWNCLAISVLPPSACFIPLPFCFLLLNLAGTPICSSLSAGYWLPARGDSMLPSTLCRDSKRQAGSPSLVLGSLQSVAPNSLSKTPAGEFPFCVASASQAFCTAECHLI